MNELLVIDEAKLRASCPGDVAQMIIEASELVEKSRQSAQEISNRGVLKSIISNNTRDLATAMLDQNRAMSLFLKMLQTTIWINLNNTVVLASINEELNKQEKARGVYQNEYLEVAKNFLSQAYASAVAFKEQFDQLFTMSDQHSTELGRQSDLIQALRDQLGDHMRHYQERTAELTERLSLLSRRFEGVQQDATEQGKSLHALEDRAAAHSASIEALNDQVRGHSEALEALEHTAGVHRGAIQALEQALGELQGASRGYDEAIRRLEAGLDEAHSALAGELQQTRTSIGEINAGFAQAAAGWESGMKSLEARVRRAHLTAVLGLCVGVVGLLGLLHLIAPL